MEKGLSEVLRSECTVDDVLQATSAEGLWSLSAGHRDAYTDQVMASSVVAKLFQELRSRFDTIVDRYGPSVDQPGCDVAWVSTQMHDGCFGSA